MIEADKKKAEDAGNAVKPEASKVSNDLFFDIRFLVYKCSTIIV